MYDAVVVGARCAGASTAMLLARKGHRVLLVDRSTFPSDMRLSNHLVWQPGVAQLRRWGLLEKLVDTGCPGITTASIDVGPFTLTGRIPGCDGVAEAYAPRRRVLDGILVEAATAPDAGKSGNLEVSGNPALRALLSGILTVTDRDIKVNGNVDQYFHGFFGAGEQIDFSGNPNLTGTIVALGGPFAHRNTNKICAMRVYDWIFDGEADWEPRLVLQMDAETANAYLQGRQSLAIALARQRTRRCSSCPWCG
jgi:hypothetical protein